MRSVKRRKVDYYEFIMLPTLVFYNKQRQNQCFHFFGIFDAEKLFGIFSALITPSPQHPITLAPSALSVLPHFPKT